MVDQLVLQRVLYELKTARKVDFSGYRNQTMLRRLGARMARLGVTSGEEYLALLGREEEKDQLLEALTVQVSSFFRDPLLWEVLAHSVLPAILEAQAGRGARDVRVWVAGCSGGEEAYSLAMLLALAMETRGGDWRSYIFATDINQGALDRARAGVYPRESLAEAKLGLVDRFLRQTTAGFEVSHQLKDMVSFSWDDLTSPTNAAPAESIFGGFDLVLCRNVLIYFSSPLREKVAAKLVRSLAPGGWLSLGNTENMDVLNYPGLAVWDKANRIYRGAAPS